VQRVDHGLLAGHHRVCELLHLERYLCRDVSANRNGNVIVN
jgi:hypothetical protein